MSRIYTFDCECGYQTAKTVEYTPGNDVEQVGEATYKVDFNKPLKGDGYPLIYKLICPACGKSINGTKMQLWEAAPVYFNYLSHEDDD